MEAFNYISNWIDAGAPWTVVMAATLVALAFLVFNTARILLYVPQLVTCWRYAGRGDAINLFTWSSWIVANASTGLYMWMFHGDMIAAALNFGSAAMCALTVAVTLFRRRLRHSPPTSPLRMA